MRIRDDGTLVILEANPNPDIAMGDEVAEAAEHAGIPYEKLIGRVIKLALQRGQFES
jgi:D-alanine-D-alanine ligase-like ATP-grasp enzyme